MSAARAMDDGRDSIIATTPSLFGHESPAGVVRLTKRQANGLLVDWRHELGECNRPFGADHWGLAVDGRLVAVAITASIVSSTVTDADGRRWARGEVVELARIARHPDHPWVLRVMLRLWRCVLAPMWQHWTPSLAVSYALPGRTGNLYRFDGWTRVRDVKPSAGGGTWSNPGRANAIGDGVKALWTHPLVAIGVEPQR